MNGAFSRRLRLFLLKEDAGIVDHNAQDMERFQRALSTREVVTNFLKEPFK
jgi:hypothetical protein